jgi:hypothetical protein
MLPSRVYVGILCVCVCVRCALSRILEVGVSVGIMGEGQQGVTGAGEQHRG